MKKSERTVLVTGGTGLLGSAIAAALTDFSVVSLTRHGRLGWTSGPRLGGSASGLLPEHHGHTVAESPVVDHVNHVRGDLTQPTFGMGASDYAQLVDEVDVIIHSAGVSDFTTPKRTTYAHNVEGTRNTLEFARNAEAPLYHISTGYIDAVGTSVRGKWGAEIYIASKRRAEELVQDSAALAAIVRPSIVWADTGSGYSPSFQGLHRLIGMMLENRMPLLPFGPETCVDFLPRDTMGNVIAELVRSDFHGVFWLTAGAAALPFGRIVEILSEYGRSVNSDVTSPRFVSRDMIERLIKPAGGAAVERRVDILLALTSHFQSQNLLPTSLEPSQIPDLENALRQGAEYWGNSNGVGEREKATTT